MAGPKILCLGMNEESASAISALIRAGAIIAAIAGLPPEKSGGASDYADLSKIAQKHQIEWIAVEDVNSDETLAAFKSIGADMLFVLGWSQLLKSSTLDAFPEGVIGSHPSDLPYGRGRAPIAWTILEDRSESAVTLFRMTGGVDDGAIVKKIHFDIPERPTARVVYDLVSKNLARCFVELYSDLTHGNVEEVPQEQSGASWRAKRVTSDGWIDFHKSAEEIERLVRAVSEPYPGAYSYICGERAIFDSAKPAMGDDLRRKGVLGQVLARRGEMILVQAADMPIWLSEPRLPADRQIGVRIGDRLGFHVEDELHELRKRLEVLERGYQS